MEEPLRLRVVFDDRKMLNKSQRSEGLKHCWLLTNPCIATIYDLESHIRKTFHLKRSCPNGIVLYMDDFVLPPFESTCVLKDKDIIRVKNKDAVGVDAIKLDDDPRRIQDSGVLDAKHIIDNEKILVVTEFGEDSDQHNRKTDKDTCAQEENAVYTGAPPSNLKNKRKHSEGILVPKNAQAEENIGGNTREPHVNGSVRKVQSRNAHRKKQKRELLREMRPLWRKNTRNQSPTSIHKESSEKQETEQNIEMEKELVPVVIRPGHIRFQPLDEEQSPWQSQEAMETLQLNGTTCNYKGQKWHRVNMSKCNDSNGYKEQFNGNEKIVRKWNDANGNRGPECFRENLGSKWNDANGYEGQKWVRENTGRKWNDANCYKGQKWARKNNGNKWNDGNAFKEQPANGYGEQFNGNQKIVSLWNDANGYKEHWNTSAGRWSNANGYIGQKWVRENTGSRWNNVNGYNEQSVGKEKAMSIRNNANCYKEQCYSKAGNWDDVTGYKRQKWVRENVGRKWNEGDAYGCGGHNMIGKNMQSKWNVANGNKEQSNGKDIIAKRWTEANGYDDQCIPKTSSKWDPSNGHKELNNSVSGSLKTKRGSCPFESLFPLTRIPQVGDVLAYRLIELSPSWCPEVSPFRVGEVTSYNYLTMSIILIPVPEFPIFSDEVIEGSDPTHKTKPSSPYNEDGSLQIHYPSLVDVRLLRASDSGATSSDCSERETSTQAAAAVNKWELAIANTKAKETVSQPKENGNASSSTWDQIKQTLNEKRAQLQQKEGWDEWAPSRRIVGTSWSYQATRGSAMTPNLANIRSQNNKYRYKK